MMTEQKIRINYIDESSIKSDAKKIKYYQISKKIIRSFSQISPPMITKHQIEIYYIEEISIKSDAKKIKYYQTSKKLFQAFR